MFFTPVPSIAAVDGASLTAYLTQITVERAGAVFSVGFVVANAAGSIDVGIYTYDADDDEFTRLWSRGVVGSPGNGPAGFAITAGSPTSLVIEPGIYWFAVASSDGGFKLGGINTQSITGVAKQEAVSGSLPAILSSPSGWTKGHYASITMVTP